MKTTGDRSFPFELRVQAFWEKVDRSNGEDACWPWIGARVPAAGIADAMADQWGVLWKSGRLSDWQDVFPFGPVAIEEPA